MAWHQITYTCGHEGREQIYGPSKSREWIAHQRGRKLCPECYQAQLQAEHDKASAEAAAWAQAMGLPPLEGTPKQVSYAETCRRRLLEELEAWSEDQQAVASPLLGRTAAHWWIEQDAFSFALALNALADAAPPLIPAADQAAMDAETTIRPDRVVTEISAAITLEGETVVIHFPEKRDDTRQLFKALHFSWKDGRWTRQIVPAAGTSRERAAEVGHRLLALGVPVRIPDPQIRADAIAGQYATEQTRWIYARVAGDFSGWFAVHWSREEDFYKAARRLAGSRYDKSAVVVPPENFDEVLDFAERYGFSVSPGAQQVVKSARARKDAALIVHAEGPPNALVPAVDALPPVLTVTEEVEIDADFRDDN